MTGTGRGEFTPERIAEIEAVAWRYREDGLTHGWVHTGSSEQRDGAIGAGFTVQPLYGLDLLSSYKERGEELERALGDVGRFKTALKRIADGEADGLDLARDSAVLERAIKVARAALQSKGGE